MRMRLLAALMVLPLVAGACSKGPAEAALKAADESIARVTREARTIMPAELEALTTAVAGAKAKFKAGDYAGALAAAKDLPARAAELARAAAAKKGEVAAQWKVFQSSVPGALRNMTERIRGVEGMRKLPKDFDPSQLTAAKTALSEAATLWAAASDAFANGDFAGALARAADVRTKADTLSPLVDALPRPPGK